VRDNDVRATLRRTDTAADYRAQVRAEVLKPSGRGGARATARRLELPIATRRLVLREFAPGDAPALARVTRDPSVLQQAPPGSRALAAAERAAAGRGPARSRQRSPSWELAVIVRRSGKLIGACDLALIGARQADIGYLLARRHWGYGYGTELARALIAHGFEALGLSRITAVVTVDNERSRRLLERAGLRWQALLRQHARAAGRWRDCHLYVLERGDWRRRAR
jgi:ribosomal-protein-alanine N-acetyltransferase